MKLIISKKWQLNKNHILDFILMRVPFLIEVELNVKKPPYRHCHAFIINDKAVRSRWINEKAVKK